MERMLANLNNELENIKESLRECLKNTQLNSNDIQVAAKFFILANFDWLEIIGLYFNLKQLREAIRLLDETKADKDWVRSEFERVRVY